MSRSDEVPTAAGFVPPTATMRLTVPWGGPSFGRRSDPPRRPARPPGACPVVRAGRVAAARDRLRAGPRTPVARAASPDPRGFGRRRPRGRTTPRLLRWPGLDGARAGAGPRAARAGHGRAVVVHPGR